MKPEGNYRVSADFSEEERNALDVLCRLDYRSPGEELRWLVMQEMRLRGMADVPAKTIDPTPSDSDLRQEEGVGIELRRLAKLAGLQKNTVLRVLVQNAPPPEILRSLAKKKHNRIIASEQSDDGAIVDEN